MTSDELVQRNRVRSILAERIDAIVEVLPASPENTVRLTIDVVTCLIWRIGEIVGDARELAAGVQHRLGQPMLPVRSADTVGDYVI